MKMKKYLIIFFLLFYNLSQSFAYTTEDYFNIYYQGSATRQDIYTIPTGKDLIINFLHADDLTNSELFFRDNGIDIAGGQFTENKNEVFLVVKDLLQLRDGVSTNNYVITGILVNEGEDISAIIDKKEYGINKPIFDKETLDTIFMSEAIIMIFILLYTFFFRIIGKKQKKKFKFIDY